MIVLQILCWLVYALIGLVLFLCAVVLPFC